jgi:hypothetical protein
MTICCQVANEESMFTVANQRANQPHVAATAAVRLTLAEPIRAGVLATSVSNGPKTPEKSSENASLQGEYQV